MFISVYSHPAVALLAQTLKAQALRLQQEAIAGIHAFSPSPERYIMNPDDIRLFILPVRWQGQRIDEAMLEPDDYREWQPRVSPERLASAGSLLLEVTASPIVVNAMYSMSMPGCEITPHIDRESAIGEVYRMHVGLDCPQGDCALIVNGERREWRNGEVFMFDSARVEHSAHNRTGRVRLIAIVDIDRRALD